MNGKSTANTAHWMSPCVLSMGLLSIPAMLSFTGRTCRKNVLRTNIIVHLERQHLGSQLALLPTAGELSCTFLWPPLNLDVVYIFTES